jgi:DNA primase (bacterial type)
MNTLFSDAAARLDILEVARRLGVQIEHGGFARCPFHNERTPSLHFDRNRGIFKCFGCGEGGDAITLMSKMKGVSRYDALRVLNDDFHLGLDLGKHKPKYTVQTIEARRVEQERRNLRAYQTFREQMMNRLAVLSRKCYVCLVDFAPRTPEDYIENYFVVACKYLPDIEHMQNDLRDRDEWKITQSEYYDDTELPKIVTKIEKEFAECRTMTSRI